MLIGTLIVLGACGGGNDDNASNNNNSGDSAAGEEVYQQNCASCHGDDLSGEAGPSLETIGADLDVDDIKDVIENGQGSMPRSEEHTSELQSRFDLVCRLLLEKKK